jgi:hypothetical protein
MRRPIGRLRPRRIQNTRFDFVGQNARRLARVADIQPGEPLREKSLLPLANEGLGTADPLRDLAIRQAVGQQQNGPRDLGVMGSAGARAEAHLELAALRHRHPQDLVAHTDQHTTKHLSVTDPLDLGLTQAADCKVGRSLLPVLPTAHFILR